MLSMTEQLTLVLVLELAFGLIFELPLVMALLSLVGMVKASWLFKYQRHAFLVCVIAAAIITPTGDAVNLSLMAGPMLAATSSACCWSGSSRSGARPTSRQSRSLPKAREPGLCFDPIRSGSWASLAGVSG